MLRRVVLLAAVLLCGAASLQAQDLVKLTVTEGRAVIIRNNQTIVLQLDQEFWLQPGDQVTLGVDAKAVMPLGDGDSISIDSNTVFSVLPNSKPGDKKGEPKILSLGLKSGKICSNLGISTASQVREAAKTLLLLQIGDVAFRTRRLDGCLQAKATDNRLPEGFKDPHHLTVNRGFVEVNSGMYMMHVRDKQEVVFQKTGNVLAVDTTPRTQGSVMMMTYGAVIAALKGNQIVKVEINGAKTAVYVTNFSEVLDISAVPWTGAPKKFIQPTKTEVFRIVNTQVTDEEAREKLQSVIVIPPSPTPPDPIPPGPIPPIDPDPPGPEPSPRHK